MFVMRTPVLPERRYTVNFTKRAHRCPPMPPRSLEILSLAVRVIGDLKPLKRLSHFQSCQFLGVFAPLGRFGECFPWTVNDVLVTMQSGLPQSESTVKPYFRLIPFCSKR